MPEYTFQCNPDRGGCGKRFSLILSFAQYDVKSNKKCPYCRHINSVDRDYTEDLSTLYQNVKLGDEQLKLGHLAKRNTERLSKDEKDHIIKKNNAYKYESSDKSLPKGMSRLGKNPSKRKTPKKQRKKDVKRGK
jgi:hypothetical protein